MFISLDLYSLPAISASNGDAVSTGDYELHETRDITFASGETSQVSQPIAIKADNVVEDTEEFTVTFSLDAATAVEGVHIAPNPVTVFIYDRTCKNIT